MHMLDSDTVFRLEAVNDIKENPKKEQIELLCKYAESAKNGIAETGLMLSTNGENKGPGFSQFMNKQYDFSNKTSQNSIDTMELIAAKLPILAQAIERSKGSYRTPPLRAKGMETTEKNVYAGKTGKATAFYLARLLPQSGYFSSCVTRVCDAYSTLFAGGPHVRVT